MERNDTEKDALVAQIESLEWERDEIRQELENYKHEIRELKNYKRLEKGEEEESVWTTENQSEEQHPTRTIQRFHPVLQSSTETQSEEQHPKRTIQRFHPVLQPSTEPQSEEQHPTRTIQRFHPVLQPSFEGVSNEGSLAASSLPFSSGSYNGWTRETEETARKWQKDIEKSSFIYGELLANNDHRMQQALVSTLLLSVLITLLSTVSLVIGALVPQTQCGSGASTIAPITGLDVRSLTWALFAFSVIQAVAAAGILVWNGLMKIYGWDQNVKKLTKFVQRLDSEWFVFETELNIPREQRQNGEDFIKRADGNYMHLMQECPPISGDDYVAANHKYQERLFGNFVWQQKFKQRIEDELAVHVDEQCSQ
jgi:hypothetical protein